MELKKKKIGTCCFFSSPQ